MSQPSEGIECGFKGCGKYPTAFRCHHCKKEKASHHLCLINYVFVGKLIQNGLALEYDDEGNPKYFEAAIHAHSKESV
jgi:hypothetical protein